jgi:hypothetical protein
MARSLAQAGKGLLFIVKSNFDPNRVGPTRVLDHAKPAHFTQNTHLWFSVGILAWRVVVKQPNYTHVIDAPWLSLIRFQRRPGPSS